MSYKPRKFQQRFSVWLKRQNLQVFKWILKLHLFHRVTNFCLTWTPGAFPEQDLKRAFARFEPTVECFHHFSPREPFIRRFSNHHELSSYVMSCHVGHLSSWTLVMSCHVGHLSSWRCVCSPFSKLTWSAVGRVLAPWQVPLSPLGLAPLTFFLPQIFRSILGQIVRGILFLLQI